VPSYRLHDTTDDDLGVLLHPAPNLEPGDVVFLPDGRETLVTSRVEAQPGPLTALLEVAIAPTPLTSDEFDRLSPTCERPADRGSLIGRAVSSPNGRSDDKPEQNERRHT
jgi:hypothetical protein